MRPQMLNAATLDEVTNAERGDPELGLPMLDEAIWDEVTKTGRCNPANF